MSATLLSAWTSARKRLEAAGVSSPVLDARILVEAGAGVRRIDIVTDPYRVIDDMRMREIEALVARREAREPVSHIVGAKGFWTLDFVVSPAVLTPRPETETLIDVVVAETGKDDALSILDLGVGSGAILLTLLHERQRARGVGLDASIGALAVAQANAQRLGLDDRASFLHGEWETADGAFDVVVSNPPYIRSNDIDLLEPEVARYEPRIALDGGPDGLDAYRRIFTILPALLKPGGLFAIEAGFGQAASLEQLATEAGLQVSGVREDLGGVGRVVWGRRLGRD